MLNNYNFLNRRAGAPDNAAEERRPQPASAGWPRHSPAQTIKKSHPPRVSVQQHKGPNDSAVPPKLAFLAEHSLILR